MAHDIDASISFYEDQARIFAEGFAYAEGSGDTSLMAFNASQIFVADAACALMRWRAGRNPVESVDTASARAHANLAAISRSDAGAAVPSGFPYERLAYFDYLLGRPQGVVKSAPAAASDHAGLDRELLALLAGGSDPRGLERAVERFAAKKRQALCAASYRAYLDILDAAQSGASLDPGLEAAERCYDLRKKDAFFSGGDEVEGGGPGNGKFVDFRLASVLKHVGYTGASIHAWKW